MTVSPGLYLISFAPSHSYYLSYGSMDANRSILLKNYSNLSRFLIEASFTILLKVARSSAKQTLFDVALIVAALGALYKSDNSPKLSPALYVFRYVGSSPFLKTL